MALPPGLSEAGYEIQFATNHLGHAMLIKLLLPTLLKTAVNPESDVRIVLNTSLGWRTHPTGGIQFDSLNTTQESLYPILASWFRYGQSKLANIVYAAELARRYPSITSTSMHPGVILTGLAGNLSFVKKVFIYTTTFWRQVSLAMGILNQLYLGAGAKKDSLMKGGYYMPVGVLSDNTLDEDAKSEKLATDLWEWTKKALEGL